MLEERLRAIPILRDLPGATLRKAASALEAVRCERGSLVFSAGDPADALYIVESGWIELSDPGTDHALASLGPGSVVGELGARTGAVRAANARAVSDTRLWRLGHDHVDRLVHDDPALAVVLSREIGRRLVAARSGEDLAPPRLVVVPSPGASSLTRALVHEGVDGIVVLELDGESAHDLPATAERLRDSKLDADAIVALGATPAEGRTIVVVALPAASTPVAEAAAGAADFGVALGGPLPAWVTGQLAPLRRLSSTTDEATLRRLARRVSGRAIAVALSSGGSKSVAHVGVIRVLREAGLTIDGVAGSSGGSVVAAAVARGVSDAELRQWVRELAPAFRFRRLGPKVPPRDALFKGTGPHTLFRAWHRGAEIGDCAIPLYVVAADLGSGTEVVIDRGAIADALRASMSIPGALEPRRWNGRFLVDGGVVSPLPSRVLRDAGFRWVIGSNVAGQDPAPTGETRPPSILETMSRMVSTREREVLSDQVALLDVEIRPVVTASNSFDFSAADRFVDEGVRAAREQLPAVERLIEIAAAA